MKLSQLIKYSLLFMPTKYDRLYREEMASHDYIAAEHTKCGIIESIRQHLDAAYEDKDEVLSDEFKFNLAVNRMLFRDYDGELLNLLDDVSENKQTYMLSAALAVGVPYDAIRRKVAETSA